MRKINTLLLFFWFCLNVPATTGTGQVVLPYSIFEKEYFQVTPNPGNGIFTLVYKSDKKGPRMLAVSDAIGKYVYLKTIRDFNGEIKETIDLGGNPKGIYIFEVESDDSRESKKVIFQ